MRYIKYFKSFEHDTIYLNGKLSIITRIFLVNIHPFCFSWERTSIAHRLLGIPKVSCALFFLKNVPNMIFVDSRSCRKCAVHRGSEKCLGGTTGCESLYVASLSATNLYSYAVPHRSYTVNVVIHWVKHYSVNVLGRKHPCCRRSLVAITGHWLYTALYPGGGAHRAAKIIL
jgi:hypothetical protein